ncbi:putative threonine efflux protein [Carbonactinospora thermoautotrophica]|uniref:Putative threonine efflux protein n=2 Tax=Carbonactinospora thermoautotrophica TaxID=1469144 RepID=A0A132MW58_9ACTN|nr:putative threonine efflux protein [Carbonactinospora thermoautotrophica]
MGMLQALLTGLVAGAVVAAQIGPVTLLVVRTALRGHLVGGLAIGLGVATVDLTYAALGAAGAAQVLRFAPLRLALGLLGAAVLGYLGVRTLASAFRIRLGAETLEEVRSPLAALRTGLVATASNPLTIASWAAVFGAASTAHAAYDVPSAVVLITGVGVGSLAWYVLVVGAVSLAGRRVSDRGLRLADALAGCGLVGFGGLLAYRTVREA